MGVHFDIRNAIVKPKSSLFCKLYTAYAVVGYFQYVLTFCINVLMLGVC